MSISKNNLFKLNGEYVKFFTTSNKLLSNIYKNSGAIIIYSELDKNNSSNNRNYIYLGGEMIASGYGSNSSTTRDKLENISANYDNDINNINKSLTYLNKSINDAFSYFENNVILKNDNVSSTYITLNNKNISLLDFLTNTVNAQYDELEIESQVNKIEYKINPSDTSSIITFLPGEEIYLPIGASIISVSTILTINYNDSGGLQQIDASFYKTSSSVENNKLKTELINNVNGNNIPMFPKTYELSDNKDTDKKVITINYIYENTNRYFVNYGENILIDNISVDSYQTTTYKPYKTKDLLDDETNIYNGIYSIENILSPKNYKCSPVKVYGSLFGIYSELTTNNQESINILYLNNNGKRILINDNNTIELPISKNMNKFIIAIPSIYNINKAIFNNGNCDENWTGNINVSKVNSLNTNYLKLYKNFDTNYNITLNMKFNLYYIIVDNNNINNLGYDGTLKLYLNTTNESLQYNTNNNNSNYIIDNTYFNPLYDEEFANLYWGDNDFKTTLKLNDKYYISTNDDFLNNPISYESNFIEFNNIDELINKKITIENSGKLYIMIPEYYKNSFTITINDKNINFVNNKLIKYNNNSYIILYNDGQKVNKNDNLTFNKINKIYFGNDIKNIVDYNNIFDNFLTLDNSKNELYNIKITNNNIKNYTGYLFVIIPDDININMKIIYNNEETMVEYNKINEFIMYDTTYKILSTIDYIDDIKINSNFIINKI